MPPSFRTHILQMVFLLSIASLAFGLGRLTLLEEVKKPLAVNYFEAGYDEGKGATQAASVIQAFASKQETGQESAKASTTSAVVTQIVASKNGKAYHYSWCPGAQAISPENKIYFTTTEEARAAGYAPAKNCKGLK